MKNSFFIFFIIIFGCTENNKPMSVKLNPTFEDIAPIIYKNCTPCHRAGESGTFD